MASKIADIFKFQSDRRLTSVAKTSLEQLERFKNYSLKLENLLKNLGFEDGEFFMSDENFKYSRKIILDNLGTNSREMDDLIEQFEIKFQ